MPFVFRNTVLAMGDPLVTWQPAAHVFTNAIHGWSYCFLFANSTDRAACCLRLTHVKRWVDLVLIAALAIGAVLWVSRRGDDRVAMQPELLGRVLPDLSLRTVTGASIGLHDRLAQQAALLFVVSRAQCTSCSNLPLEFAILRREFPAVQAIVVASGASPEVFRSALDSMSLGENAIVDEHRLLLRAIGWRSEPLTLLVDTGGRILFVDSRTRPLGTARALGQHLASRRGLGHSHHHRP